MRKIGILFTTVVVLVLLMACGKETTAIAEFEDMVYTYINETITVTFNVVITDTNEEITGTTIIYLYNKDGSIKGSKTNTPEQDLNEISFAGLDSNIDYSIKVIATVGRDAIVIGEYKFTTPTDQDVVINSVEDFLNMKDNRNGKFILGQDIDFQNIPFSTPFGTSNLAFGGTFDGNGYVLKNIVFAKTISYTGVFGHISSGVIKNTTFENVQIGSAEEPLNVPTSSRIGIINAYTTSQKAEIKDVVIKDSAIFIKTSSNVQTYVGAISGEHRGIIKNVDILNTTINVETTSYARIKLGGAIGFSSSTSVISEVYSEADIDFKIEGTGIKNRDITHMVGGVVGEHVTGAKVFNIISTGDITAQMNYNTSADTDKGTYRLFVGGLVGKAKAGISQGFYKGSITVSHEKNENEDKVIKQFGIGGLIGFIEANTPSKQLVRMDGSEITITVSDDVLLDASQVFGSDRFKMDSDTGVSGTEHLLVNNDSKVPENGVKLILEDLDTYFSSDWLKLKLVV